MGARYLDPNGEAEQWTRRGVEYTVERMEDGLNVSHFYVNPEFRGEGRGRDVMRGIIDEARSNGFDYVVVNIGDRETSLPFLRSLGFDIVEAHPDHVTAEIELSSGLDLF
jgi:GNAT superfamily N-acetyltransferase